MRIAVVIAAFFFGALIALAGVVMGGAGHGWSSAMVSAIAVITAPAGAVAWAIRNRAAAITVTVLNVASDIAIIALTLAEGVEHAQSTWEHGAGFVIGWAALWLGWQVLPMLALRRYMPTS